MRIMSTGCRVVSVSEEEVRIFLFSLHQTITIPFDQARGLRFWADKIGDVLMLELSRADYEDK